MLDLERLISQTHDELDEIGLGGLGNYNHRISRKGAVVRRAVDKVVSYELMEQSIGFLCL